MRTAAFQGVLDLSRVVFVDEDGNAQYGETSSSPVIASPPYYTSQVITQADFTSGSTKSIALTSPPTNMVPIGCYVVTTGTVAGNGASTNALTVEVGRSADPDSLMKSVSVFGAAGRKAGLRGDELNSLRVSDALEIKFTAGGGAPNVTDITGLSLRVVILYAKAPV